MAQLFIPHHLLDKVIPHCQEIYPKEACGILAAYLSPNDIQLAFYSESVYVIVGISEREPKIRAFSIKEGNVEEVEIKVIVK